ncbi:ATP-binding protein [Mariniluteicoccus flavus]
MTLFVVSALALVVGVCLGALVARPRRAPAATDPAPEQPELDITPQPEIPPGVSEVISVLRSSAVIVGPHDEVLQSTSQARTLGLVRGTRIAVPTLLELVRDVRRDREIRTMELQLRRGGGNPTLFLSARVAAVENLILVLAEDRTAARRVEETRRDFVANVSHELKTPIGAISLLSEAVTDAADDPDAVRNFAGRMNKESARLGELVGQIIELSRLQADDPLMTADVVEIDDVIDDALDRCREAAAGKSINLTRAGQRGCEVVGDAEQLATAVVNLVENAIIYSDPRGRVAVAARTVTDADDTHVEISVSDSGIGIAAGDLHRVFERFYRVDYARSRANGGTGLGLSIVKHIAAAHGGTVNVWSQEGQGSTFTIRVPAYAERDQHPAQGPVPAPIEEMS